MSAAGPVGMWWFPVTVHGIFALYILYRLAERPGIPVSLQKVFAPLPAPWIGVGHHPDALAPRPLPAVRFEEEAAVLFAELAR